MDLSSPANNVSSVLPDIKRRGDGLIVALAGNPNVGKSTVFNALTGMRQHTGNWPGKTVDWAFGTYSYNGHENILVDTPGAYSLFPTSAEEEVTRDFITEGGSDVIVIVCDASCLERNLNLVLQILSFTSDAVVCVNLIDEAAKKGIHVDIAELERLLGIPAVATSARSGAGLSELMEKIERAAASKSRDKESAGPCTRCAGCRGNAACKYGACAGTCTDTGLSGRKTSTSVIFREAEDICSKAVRHDDTAYDGIQLKLDRLLTQRSTGIPVMLVLLAVVFYITMVGANLPSEFLWSFFSRLGNVLDALLYAAGCPEILHSLLLSGVYRTVTWVVSFMLPPMAIFFPLFTLLEDLGYLPRAAFNLDNAFRKCGACGKQSLTMCMGFGCNAAGVVGCRIIESPRERLVAVITNSFVPCNGRFPTLVALITVFFAGTGAFSSALSAVMLTGFILLGVFATFFVSKLLSSTVLKGFASSTAMEMPPFRRPQVGRVIVRSVFDRTLFVLGRAAVTAAPAGLIIWLMANLSVGGESLLSFCAGILDPFARVFGLDGIILTAFILSLPANEILIPVMIMAYTSSGTLIEYESLSELYELFIANGWTALTALNVMFFSIMHWPCATTLLTIKKETGSLKWTLVSFIVPAICGLTLCFITASVYRAVF